MGEIPVTPTEWNQLVTQSEINTIFQTYEWFESWWKVFGTHSQLYLISVLQEQRVVGIAPLMISGRVFRRLKFVGDGKSDYCDFIICGRKKCAILAAMWKQIASDSHLWDSIVLSNIPEESSTCDVLEEVCGARRMWIVSSVMHVSSALVEGGDGDQIRKKIGKRTLTRRFNHFAKNGSLQFANINGEEVLEHYLEIFFEQHVKRWSAREERSLFLDLKNRSFYRELARSLLKKGWLLFSVLEYNGEPIAFHFGFDYNEKLTWYKPSFDIRFSKRSPGKVLLRFLLEHAVTHNRREVDFTIGEEPFKDEFANRKSNNLQIKITRSAVVHLGQRLLHSLRLKGKGGSGLQLKPCLTDDLAMKGQ